MTHYLGKSRFCNLIEISYICIMDRLYAIIAAVLLFAGCQKGKVNPDDLIVYKTYYKTNKITCDTLFVLYVPTGFTPNGDRINDYWEPKSYGLDSSDYHIDILDKSGKTIFSSDTPVKFWGIGNNGKTLPAQTFGYYIKARDIFWGEHYTFSGKFSLIQ